MPALVLLVGHCMPDSFSLSRAVKASGVDAVTKRVNTTRALDEHLEGAALLLVNRALDGRFDAADGIELIRALRERGGETASPPMILVSNYPEAQAEAEAAGALPGFGKHDLRTTAPERIASALGGRTPHPQ